MTDRQTGYQLMYLGAFAALLIPNVEMAKELAELTKMEQDAVHAIGIMRDAPAGNRVWPALDWLRQRRAELRQAHAEEKAFFAREDTGE